MNCVSIVCISHFHFDRSIFSTQIYRKREIWTPIRNADERTKFHFENGQKATKKKQPTNIHLSDVKTHI